MKWFKHYTDASSDFKILMLEEKYGAFGYAAFWKTVEFVAFKWTGFGEPTISTTLQHYRKLLRTQSPRAIEILTEMQSSGLMSFSLLNEQLFITIPNMKKIRDNANYKKVDERGLTAELKDYIVHRDNNQCSYCLETLSGQSFNFDHFIPASLGGGSGKDNIVLSCDKCNKIKWMHHPDQIEQGGFSFSSKIGAIRKKLSLEKEIRIKNKEEDKELVAKATTAVVEYSTPTAPALPKKSSDPFLSNDAKEIISAIPKETKHRWLRIYDNDLEFIQRELDKAIGYYFDNSKKKPKSKRGWLMALSSWLERGWSFRAKTIKGQVSEEQRQAEILKAIQEDSDVVG